MSEVGIMTWFQYNNYGTALQVTAMSEILKKMGCSPFKDSRQTTVLYKNKRAKETVL